MTSRRLSRVKSDSPKFGSPYVLEFPRRKDFPLDDIKTWIEYNCAGNIHYKNLKRKIIYEFQALDDAFRFRLYFGEHLDR